MVGGLLNLLDTGGILLRKVAIDVAQGLEKAVVEIFQLRKGQFTKCNEILNLYAYTITDEGVF